MSLQIDVGNPRASAIDPDHIDFALSAADAFGRLRVSSPKTLFDSKQVYDGDVRSWWLTGTGGGSYSYSKPRASTTLIVTSASGDSYIRQTRQYFNYQPGKSQLVFMTFVFGAAHSSLRRRAGIFSVNDGIYLEQNGTDLRLVQRSSVSGAPSDAEFAPQSAWNLDKLDGTGPSGQTLDLTKPQILIIDYEWLGVGLVRVAFVTAVGITYVHVFKNPNNIITSVYMQTPNLPARYEIARVAAGPGGTATLECICTSVMSEGGQDQVGRVWSADRGIAARTAPVGSLVSVIAIRWKAGYQTRAMTLQQIEVHDTTANGTVLWRLLRNPTRGVGTAPTWVDVSTGESGMQYDISSTEILTNGRLLYSGYSQGRTSSQLATLPQQLTLMPADYAATTSDEFVVAAQTATGGAGDAVLAAIIWAEL
jgi:hypothetical protein